MPDYSTLKMTPWSRRRFLYWGLAAAGITGASVAVQHSQRSTSQAQIPPFEKDLPTYGNGISPMQVCRDFDYGTIKQENGRTIREFQITASSTTLQLNQVVSYPTWNYNGRVPGPTLRATEGDRVRVVFLNEGGHAHTMHFHGIHPSDVDGVKPVRNGTATIYEFDAIPYGLHLYHCHIAPVARHIGKGLHGMFIIDPKQGRAPADELVLVMNGYDLDENNQNELYAFNGIPNYYRQNPISIYQNQLVRVYLLNVIEFDPAVTFHLHANFFRLYPTGMTTAPTMETDVITMGTAERHILEFAYPYAGKYMFHPHQDAIAESGCMGVFNVLPSKPA
ncbi:multicopper oxidase domain-containing protein [Phormidium tenue FACHB-886]|nr:multicopper oxidase domain-containing protein [Phormidium tenue FACHB-886]